MTSTATINYVEFAARDLAATKAFFERVFEWTFTDYGPDYSSFSAADAGLDGGFFSAPIANETSNGGALVVFFANDLDSYLAKVVDGGGNIVKPIFEFPGGRRFHFKEPSGNEFAVWGHPIENFGSN
ncbi:VOC family protein [Echinimonas agarilytica]|uniref:VOC family protein n=1 Tax=Echinimonas agarilytica TaxID=1215918 RepID=A0AA41W3S4_9GAMM|nr:VOC family protein [Echinimonas agarilytica]MCM2678270.1 VOC family protein [Echinimonas agarilytica]